MFTQLKIATVLISSLLSIASGGVLTELAPRAATTACAADNCLRALSNRYTATAESFCKTYTTQPSATIPTYATSGCANNPSRVTSACSCLATSYYAPKPLHRVYGPADNVSYTYYDESVNIRSDGLEGGSWETYLNNCRNTCGYYGNTCQTMSFGIANSGRQVFYLCYIMTTVYDPNKVQSAPGYSKYVVEARWQT